MDNIGGNVNYWVFMTHITARQQCTYILYILTNIIQFLCFSALLTIATCSWTFSKNIHSGSGAHPASHSVGKVVPFPLAEWLGCDVDCPPPSSAKVKSKWSHTCSPICLHCMDVKFTLTSSCQVWGVAQLEAKQLDFGMHVSKDCLTVKILFILSFGGGEGSI